MLIQIRLLFVEEASKHFIRRQNQTTFVVFGALRVDNCEFQFTFGHKFHEMAHVCAAQTTIYMYFFTKLLTLPDLLS